MLTKSNRLKKQQQIIHSLILLAFIAQKKRKTLTLAQKRQKRKNLDKIETIPNIT